MTQHEFENLENGLSKITQYIFIAGIVVGILLCTVLAGIMFVHGNLKLS